MQSVSALTTTGSRGAVISTGRSIAMVAVGVCLLTLGAKIQISGPVPATLQTLVVYAIAATCGLRVSVSTTSCYLLAGLAGVPVFANTPPLPAGPAYFLGPTGGFLVGMMLVGAAVGYAADRRAADRAVTLVPLLAISAAAIFSLGFFWVAAFARYGGNFGFGWTLAWSTSVAPFLPGEFVKVLLVGLAVPKLRSVRHLASARNDQ